MRVIIYSLSFALLIWGGCANSNKIDISPHEVNPYANVFYEHALAFLDQYYDADSTRKSIVLLDKAIEIDSMNPDYYGLKGKLFAEIGLLDSALYVQRYADKIGAVNGEYLLQLGLFQAAKGLKEESIFSFKRSNEYLLKVLEEYPDSLGAFINQQAANALYKGVDSLFMNDKRGIRARFSDRLMEVEMTRRIKPSTLIKQLQKIEEDAMRDLVIEIEKEHFLNKENDER